MLTAFFRDCSTNGFFKGEYLAYTSLKHLGNES